MKVRELKLHYAIHDDKEKISPKMVAEVRAVQKSFLATTTKLLRKSEEPLITLDKDFLAKKVEDLIIKGPPLRQFTKAFTSETRPLNSFLPFKLIVTEELFQRQNHQSLLDCLTHLGNELVELEINYPTNAVGIPPLNFPLLKKLSFQFCDDEDQETNKRRSFGFSYNPMGSLQHILYGSENLKELTFPFKADFGSDPDVNAPTGIQYLCLPDTLTSLELGLKLKTVELESLLLELAHLEHLKVQTHRVPFENELLFKILTRFKNTLKSFNVGGLWSTGGQPSPRTYLQFPIMEKSETISIDSVECELGPGDLSGLKLKECLPKLNRLELAYQTEEMLSKWVNYYNSDSVEEMVVSIINEHLEHDHVDFYKSLESGMMEKINRGFPNLRNLTLEMNISEMGVLKYLFKRMDRLQALQINLRGDIGEDG